ASPMARRAMNPPSFVGRYRSTMSPSTPMYRTPDAATCPACGSPLTALGTALPASACASCGGAWLTNESTIHLMQGVGDAYDAQVVRTSHVVAEHAPSHPPPDQPGRGCPTCASSLSPIVVCGITVDSCPAHGTWFDRDEVEKLALACKKQREEQARLERDGPPITAAGVAEDAAQI